MKKAKRMEQTEAPVEAPKRRWPGLPVAYNSGICPNCGSTRNRIIENYGCTDAGTVGIVRRTHECYNCKTCFATSQEVPRKDIEFLGASAEEKKIP